MDTNRFDTVGALAARANAGWLVSAAAVVCVVVLATACGSEATTSVLADTAATETTAAPTTTVALEPTGPELEFPITLRGRTLGLDKLTPIEGGQLVDISGILLADDSSQVQATFQLIDLRVEDTSTTCNGETHEGFTAEHDVKSDGTIEVPDWGTIEMSFDQTWTYFPSAASPPTCDEQIGTWTGVEGVPDGMTGTFHRLRVDTIETVVLTPSA